MNSEGRQVDVVGVVDGASIGRLIVVVVALSAGVPFLDGATGLAIETAYVIVALPALMGGAAIGLVRARHQTAAAYA